MSNYYYIALDRTVYCYFSYISFIYIHICHDINMLESEFRHFTMSRQNTRYHCPWEPMIIVGVAGSSGSGKSSVSQEIINLLDLPGASILVMVFSLLGRKLPQNYGWNSYI